MGLSHNGETGWRNNATIVAINVVALVLDNGMIVMLLCIFPGVYIRDHPLFVEWKEEAFHWGA